MDYVIGEVVRVYITKAYSGNRDIATIILNLSTKWQLRVNFTAQSLNVRG